MNTELSTPETMPQYMFQLSKYKDATHETNNILSAEQNIQQNPIFFNASWYSTRRERLLQSALYLKLKKRKVFKICPRRIYEKLKK